MCECVYELSVCTVYAHALCVSVFSALINPARVSFRVFSLVLTLLEAKRGQSKLGREKHHDTAFDILTLVDLFLVSKVISVLTLQFSHRMMWIIILVFLMFYFELHTRLFDLIRSLPTLAQSLSPKFYFALTGTASLLSGKQKHKKHFCYCSIQDLSSYVNTGTI